MLLELRTVEVPPGQHVRLHEVSWSMFEEILVELGDRRSSRIAYADGVLDIFMPLPEHETDKELIGDLIKALLEELEIDVWSLGSTTFKNQWMAQGIEPDQCFYITHEAQVRGKKRLDLTVDPPPDLALEVDVTSRTHPEIYARLGVPELWRFDRTTLEINRLENREYQPVEESLYFPGMDLRRVIPVYLQQAIEIGRNQTLKAFREWV